MILVQYITMLYIQSVLLTWMCYFAGFPADGEVTETDLSEELPLCCCRMETPCSGESLSQTEHTCMATESVDGLVKLTCSEASFP